MTIKTLEFDELSLACSERVKKLFNHTLRQIPSPDLKAAMEYALFNSGKFLRPLLVYAAGSVFEAPLANLDIPACAVELIHTYSLIHDDLPAMDNADLRRGKPSCHKVFGEGIAVLTGDALLTLALEIIASHPAPLAAERRLQMIKVLSHASGPYGMVAGQTLDITLTTDADDILPDIYQLKTGALFSACIELGRLSSADDNAANQQALSEFSDCIGLAFQIQDDILDIEASTETLGKPSGIDHANAKLTYPGLHGLPAARRKVQSLYHQALQAIEHFGAKGQLLREVANRMLQRQK